MRHGGCRPVGGKPVGGHLCTACAGRVVRQAVSDQARPYAGDSSGVRGRHAGRASHPSRDGQAADRAVPCLVERRSRDGLDQPPARTAHGRGAASDRAGEEGLRDGHGGGPLRARCHRSHEDLHLHPRRPQPQGLRRVLQEVEPHAAARLERSAGVDALRLPREGNVLRIRQSLLCEQRHVLRGGDEGSPHAVRLSCVLGAGRPELDAHPHEPVHRDHDA